MTPILSIAELLALPYGEEVSDGVTTTEDLLALNYAGGSPNMKGLNAAAYRADMHSFGEPIQWLRAVEGNEGPNGELPQGNKGKFFVDALLDSDVRVFLYQSREDVQDEEFGLIKTGTWMLSFMPDEMQPQRDDRFVATWRKEGAREVLEPSSATTRALDYRASRIEAIYGEGDKLLPSSYAISNGALMWLGTPPTGPVTVLYEHYLTFEWLGDGVKFGPRGSDNLFLPTTGPLKLLSAGE